MLTIARTLVGNLELLLLDEPSKGLAQLVVEALLHNISALKQQGVTILLAAQGVDFSLALADRVYVLEKGRIGHTGPAAELRYPFGVESGHHRLPLPWRRCQGVFSLHTGEVGKGESVACA